MGLVRDGLVVGVLLCLPGCGGGPTETQDDGATVITLTDALRFSPADLTIDPGTTVRWVASTSLLHTVTPTTPAQPGVWTSTSSQRSGTVLRHTFTIPGQVYTYFCEPHQASGMTGRIAVR